MFCESDLEQMLINTICKNGWTYIPAEMLPRAHSDVMVESMVRDALIRLNPEIAAKPEYADDVIYKLRTVVLSVQPHNLVTQNEQFKKMVFEENSYPFGKDGRMIPVRFFGADADLSLNEYVVTNQWVFPKEDGGRRLDIVLLINGFPISVGELKTPTRSAVTWLDGAGDISAYEKSIPQMFVTNVFNFASEGKCFRYGSVNMPINLWGPWHTPDNKNEGRLADVQRSAASMFRPEIAMDIFQFFTLFATDKKFRKYKIICRYQQYEGANLIVERVKAGYPKKGLIWHFQGSGKSLLMVFAAQKLRMTPELKNPTVVIVDDRIDLETQITSTFNASDVPNLQSASSREELIAFFKGDMRKILITTIYKFGEVDGVLNLRDNIILMVDEAHRTQEGNLGEKMRMALPNAFFFGLTGTPINRTDKNTFFAFGANEDKSGYMSRYSFSDSIRDNATLPLHFEAVPIELRVNREIVDETFDEMADEIGLTVKEKSEIAWRVNIEAIMKSPERIRKVCEHIARHFRERIEPNGFKGQVVCYDRECCVLYKKILDELIGEEATTIVMDTNNDKEGKYKEYRRDRDAEGRLLDYFREPGSSLKLVIVTAKLLTGFDAPILQVMYLDKPMRDHTLLQAICRTNRVFGQTKSHGLIVDYIGIFDDVARALDFDEKNVQRVITNIDEVKKQLPALMDKCLSWFIGVDRTVTGWEGLLTAQESLPTNLEKDAFGADYRVLSRAWEALSPDIFLAPYKSDYIWVSKVYESVRPVSHTKGLIWAAFGAKTLEIVHQNIEVASPPDVAEILELDADLIDAFFENNKNSGKKTKELEINLIARIRKHDRDDRFIRLGERLEELREKHEQGLITSIEFLKHLLVLAKEVAEAEREVVPEIEIDKGKAALTELFNGIKNEKTPIIVERIVADIDGIVKIVRFPGWQNTTAGQQEVKRALRSVVWVKYKIKDSDVFDKAYRYIEIYY